MIRNNLFSKNMWFKPSSLAFTFSDLSAIGKSCYTIRAYVSKCLYCIAVPVYHQYPLDIHSLFQADS